MEQLREQDTRSAYLLGTSALERLKNAHVIIFGIGGVGSYCTEALARVGVGTLTLVDHDTVSESNINRQLIALHSTVGQYKTDVAAARIRDINPDCTVITRHEFFLPENADTFDFSTYDYIVDAVDTVSAKVALAVQAHECGTPIISCMGAGNKLDPTKFVLTDLFETSGDPLARVMRSKLRKCGIKSLRVVSSTEPASPLHEEMAEELPTASDPAPRRAPGSLAFVPSVAGLIAASAVVRDLTEP